MLGNKDKLILILMPLAEQRGGGELMLVHLLQNQQELPVRYHVLFLEDGPMVQQVESFGVTTSVISAGRLRQLSRLAATVFRIAKIARAVKADAILSWMPKAHLYGAPASWLSGIPSYWYQLGIPLPASWIDRLASSLGSSGILTLSRAGQRAQRTLSKNQRVRLVYPGVELDRFDPDALPSREVTRKNLGIPGAVPVVGIVGRLQTWKGMHVLIEAMPAILEAVPNTLCLIVGGRHDGESSYEDDLKGRVARLRLEHNIKFTGLQKNVEEWMHAMDVVVHASDNEPFGIVVIEAMALGRPVVAGAEGGPAEVVEEGQHGMLAPYGDADVLARKIVRLLLEPELASSLGKAARARAAEFSTGQFARNLSETMLDLIHSRNELGV